MNRWCKRQRVDTPVLIANDAKTRVIHNANLLGVILSYCNDHERAGILGRVCKLFRDAVQRRWCHSRTVDMRTWPPLATSALGYERWKCIMQRVSPWVETLIYHDPVYDATELLDYGEQLHPKRLPRLKTFCFSGNGFPCNGWIPDWMDRRLEFCISPLHLHFDWLFGKHYFGKQAWVRGATRAVCDGCKGDEPLVFGLYDLSTDADPIGRYCSHCLEQADGLCKGCVMDPFGASRLIQHPIADLTLCRRDEYDDTSCLLSYCKTCAPIHCRACPSCDTIVMCGNHTVEWRRCCDCRKSACNDCMIRQDNGQFHCAHCE